MPEEQLQLLAYLARNSPKEARYQLLATNPAAARRQLLQGIAVTVAIALGGFFKLAPISVLQVVWLPLTLAGGLYITFRLLKQTTVPLIVTMRAEGLHLQWTKTRLDQLVSFGQISTYRIGTFGVDNALQLRLNDASKLTMANDPAAPTGQRLAELMPHFEKVLQAYQPPTGALAPRRINGLLEKLITTVVNR